MIIYEVNLEINGAIYEEFLAWLHRHIAEMLTFEGFIKADLLIVKNQENPTTQQLSVVYTIDTAANYQHYLTKHAPQMRSDGVKKFANQFTIQRRVLELCQSFKAH